MDVSGPGWRRRDCLHALGALSLAGGLVPGPASAADPVAPAWTPLLARQALALLTAAGEHGLDPADYGVEALARELPGALGGPPGQLALSGPVAALNNAFLRYLRHLAFGRVDPRQVHHRFSVAPRAGFDPAQALSAALASGRLDDAVRAALPPMPVYRQLQLALAALRALGNHPAWAVGLPPLPVPRGARAGKLEPGQPWAGLPLLAQRLALLGDLPANLPVDSAVPERLEGPLLAALQAFQQRHGLAADGVIGPGTMAALEVSPADRARQVELGLERLRWTPLMHGPRMVVVNIPEYVLRAYEVIDGRIRLRLNMRVIVGKAMDHETPLFDERMRSIEFSPYWNVPPSIARAETVPRLRRDPGHWDRQGFEFVAPDGSVDTVLSRNKLDAVLAGRLRIRQRPGPANALGDVKFVLPNQNHIFLHHTPSVGLFARERRDFSHGCIRVEDPVALARFVMDGMPGWDEARIRSQMALGTSTHVALQQPLPVVIAYGTVLVKDGRTHFFSDVYGHDARLQAAIDSLHNRPREIPR
ncbi:MAG: L,D-transpeptidase family protein [Hydrogenophaga sp.]|nr:L,D-transpeptidase family protein [Hydrogenophaga sp.]